MTKRVLSVIMVVLVFFGGYAVIPSGIDLIKNAAVCASEIVRPGAYKVKNTFKVKKWIGREKKTRKKGLFGKETYYEDVYEYKTYKYGSIVAIDRWGRDKDGFELASYVGKNLTPYIVNPHGVF